MSIAQQPLVKVNTLSSKLANQITFLRFGMPKYAEVLRDLERDYIRPIGWCAGDSLKGHSGEGNFWLVCWNQNYYFVPAPRNTHSLEQSAWLNVPHIVHLPQLFIS